MDSIVQENLIVQKKTANKLPKSKHCVYKNCLQKSRSEIPGVRFHQFPVNNHLKLKTWIMNSNRPDLIQKEPALLKNMYICSQHFSPEDYASDGKFLRRDAVPNVYKSDDTVSASEEDARNEAITDKNKKIKADKSSMIKELAKRKRMIISLTKEVEKLKANKKTHQQEIRRMRKQLDDGIVSNDTLMKILRRRIQNGFLLLFLMMQFFHKTRNVFTEEEKQLAMSMHYTSPSLYRKMREEFGFILPAASTMKKWFKNIEMWPGICTNIFQSLKMKAKCMSKNERQCVLMFDEMKIKKGFNFNEKLQKCEGFEDLGAHGHSSAVATSVLVFMIRGLLHSWKQPIAYFLTAGTLHAEKLCSIINSVLSAVLDTGLQVRAIVCDQGSNNRSAIKERVTIEKPYFIFQNMKIYAIADVPHVFKSIRNQLLQYNMIVDDNEEISWNDVRALWNLERDKGTRAACKLTEKHIHPKCFDKMKCRLALQVFSRRVAAALQTAGAIGAINSETIFSTAKFFLTLNDLFDNLNSRNVSDANPQKCALSNWRPDVEKNLADYFVKTKEWCTLTQQGRKAPPCLQGLRMSINAILQLWNELRNEEIQFLMTSRLNQDPLENLFSMIRTYGGTYNPNPTAQQFRLILQKNIVINLNKPAQSANCIDDLDDMMTLSVRHSSDERSNMHRFTTNVEIEDFEELEENIDQIVLDASVESGETLESCAVEYFAGYVAKKCIEKTFCERCLHALIDESNTLQEERQILIFFRAYETMDEAELGHLHAPSKEFSLIFKIMNKIFDSFYPSMRGNYGIMDSIYKFMEQGVHLQFPGWFDDDTCGLHRKNLAYYTMKVKIYKDLRWLGEYLRQNTKSNTKSNKKLKILQSY